jgi:DEAD/DEAH box helicase domain-containing protein
MHYGRNPDLLFSSPYPTIHLDLTNSLVREAHLQCAAHEIPIHISEDSRWLGEDLEEICKSAHLRQDREGWWYPHGRYLPNPAKHVRIRNVEDDNYKVLDYSEGAGGKLLEEIEWSRAVFECYEGGIFLHQGRTYLVKSVDHDRREGRLVRVEVDWHTKQRFVQSLSRACSS